MIIVDNKFVSIVDISCGPYSKNAVSDANICADKSKYTVANVLYFWFDIAEQFVHTSQVVT